MHKILLSTLLLTSLAFSETSYSFVGAQTSIFNYDGTTAPALGLKYGIQRGMWRSAINLDFAKNGSNDFTSLIFQTEKGIFKNSFKEFPFKPHAGFSFGAAKHNSNNGYLYGVNTGLTYLLNDRIDLDLNYRIMTTSELNMGSFHGLSFSLHYFY